MGAKGGFVNCIFDPGIAEAYACRAALQWILTKKLNNVTIESDCEEVVRALQWKTEVHTYVGRIISECLRLQEALSNIEFCYMKREANECAHRIERNTITSSGIGEWSLSPPTCIATLVNH